MKRSGFFLLGMLGTLLMVWAVGIVFQTSPAWAAAGPNNAVIADYSGVPPFVASVVAPNILFIMDNSGSMTNRACESAANCSGAGTLNFTATATYSGYFDSLRCYNYDAANTRFEISGAAKASVNSTCGASGVNTLWDGNLLNWVIFRRFDAVKKAMSGGDCHFVAPATTGRDVNGLCNASGAPAKKTIRAQTKFSSTSAGHETTPTVPKAGADGWDGRVPFADAEGGVASTGTLTFHLRGGTSGMQGSFCLDGGSVRTAPSSTGTSCANTDATAFVEKQLFIRIVVPNDAASNPIEPTGVIQDLGDKARFGLMEFKGSAEGGRVLTGIGSRQSINFSDNVVETFVTNKAAMVDAIEESFPSTNTPLAESLYDGVRYIAQLPSAFLPGVYSYPVAFSPPGVAFGTAGEGSIGPGELSALTAVIDTTCPPGYIGTTVANCAAGRDPYFFGSNHSPSWASPSATVACCKTFIILLTDGEPTADTNIPGDGNTGTCSGSAVGALCDYGHANIGTTTGNVHGRHCTGANATIHAANGTCNTNSATPPATLLSEHKTDYGTGSHYLDDVAYWAHINDLRPDNGNSDSTKACNTTFGSIPKVAVISETGHCISGFQNVTLYTLFAFGNIAGREILMQAARQGGFEDSNGNKRPDLVSEYDRTDNVTGLLVPDGIPDTYFESANADDIKNKLVTTITSILQKAASGTSVSVLATSSTGEGAIYQAYFFPVTFVTIGSVSNEVLWTGFAQGLFIDKFGNLREDYSTNCSLNADSPTPSLPDGQLVLTHDCIIKIRLDTDPLSASFGQVLIDRFADDGNCTPSTACAAGDGIADTTTPIKTVTLTTGGISNVRPMWEAGRQLALLDPGASCESQPTNWPKTGNLAESGRLCRRILTWADISGGFGTSSSELLEFGTANKAALCPFLGGTLVAFCTDSTNITAADITANPGFSANLCAAGTARNACALSEATSIINFTRGFNVTGLRDRTFNVINTSGAQVTKVWKLGDIINSTPIVVGGPKERYDVIYGDATYASFFQRYKDRRQVAYVGANDGMLHAFNGGFFTADDSVISGSGSTDIVQVRFSTTPKVKGSATVCAGNALPCGATSGTYPVRSDAPALGAELWGYIPQDLLPQLRWMTGVGYDHVYYVDLKPKITDVRIFTADADHPGGWGTILIGGFRMGGSCSNCGTKGTPRVVSADFGAGTVSRVFLSAYFVLDITNPEKEPKLLWEFKDKDLGLTAAAPAVLRVNPAADAKTSSTNEKWYVVFGSGPTHHDGFSGQTGKVYAVDLKNGPLGAMQSKNRTSGTSGDGTACSTTLPCIAVDNTNTVRTFSTGSTGSFMGDVVTLDSNLDFRVDTLYAGYTRCNGTATSSACSTAAPQWTGAMWRLTTNSGDIDPDTWGIPAGTSPCPAGSLRCPTKLLSALKASVCTAAAVLFTGGGTACNVGPVTSAAALTSDNGSNIWILFGTGRFFAGADKLNLDIQHYYGVKDSFLMAATPAQTTERNNLFNSSGLILCADCAADANVSTTGDPTSFTTGFDQLVTTITNLDPALNMDGWFTTFSNPPAPLTPGERNLNSGTLVGGTLFFTTFTPVNDICVASGTGRLYAVFYQTGGPYKDSALGTTTSGSHSLMSKSVSLGEGLPSQAAVQLGAQGSGTSGASSSAGCSGRATIYIQSSTGVLGQNCGKTALQAWSRMLSWRDL